MYNYKYAYMAITVSVICLVVFSKVKLGAKSGGAEEQRCKCGENQEPVYTSLSPATPGKPRTLTP